MELPPGRFEYSDLDNDAADDDSYYDANGENAEGVNSLTIRLLSLSHEATRIAAGGTSE